MPELSEHQLVELVKTKQDSDAVSILIERHSGIYLSVIGRYCAAYPNALNKGDLTDDRMFNMHRFIVDYDPKRGTKLSTYIGDRTDWMCRSLVTRDKENPIASGSYGPHGPVSLTIGGDGYATPSGVEMNLVDYSPQANVVDVADRDLATQDVLKAAKECATDERFVSILTYRHLNPTGPTSLSWREIGKRLSLSHEGARKCYNTNLAIVKRYLNLRGAGVSVTSCA